MNAINSPSDADDAPPPIQIVGLYQGSGTHYVNLWCGGGDSPPQRQTMIVDTGSSTTALACLPDCSPRRCGRLHHAPFHPAQSRTFRKVSHCDDCRLGTCVTNAETDSSECVWKTSYQEGSNWTAFEAIDQCFLGSWPSASHMPSKQDEYETPETATSVEHSGLDPHRAALDFSFDLRFGCQTQLSGLFRTQTTAGIMGLDRSGTAASLWSQMFQQGKILQPAFSLCLARGANERSFAGALTLGGTDARLRTASDSGNMVYAALNPEDRSIGYFALQLRQLYLQFNNTVGHSTDKAKIVPISSLSDPAFRKRRIVIDSGTTDTFFVQE
jgi:Xylanase inhibitor N-terminal